MAKEYMLDLNNMPQGESTAETIVKLGQYAKKLQEGDARLQRFVQSFTLEKPTMMIDPESIRNAVSEYQGDPVIPDGFFERVEVYQKQSLETLQSINENTANLFTIVDLINKNNDKQEEILAVLAEVLAIAAAKDKKEAETLFKKVMRKISETTDNADVIIKIVGWATTIYQMVSTMLP